jgi:rubrerythrin
MHDSDRLTIEDGDADTAAIAAYETTRRDAVRRGLAAGGAVIGAALVPALLSVRDAFAAAQTDAGVLASAIRLENTAVAAYAAALKSGVVLTPQFRQAITLFGRQEAEHAAALTTALKGLGGTPPAGTDAKLLAPLKTARSQEQVAAFAIELETMAVAAYYDAAQKLQQARLRQTSAQIMANEGQHLVVLRQALGKNPVPHPFETGKGKTSK